MTPRTPRFSLMLLVCLAAAGCSAPRINTTRLGSIDLVNMTDQMTASLMQTPAVGLRSPASDPWRVTIDRVSNQTQDILPEGEKRAFIARLRAQLSQEPTLRQHQIHFIAPADQRQQTAELHTDAVVIRPTHALTATFYSASHFGRAARSDAYLAAFQLLDLVTNQIVWEDRYEVKYAVERNKLD